MIILKSACVGIRCPVCEKNVIEHINRFQFASGITINCPYCSAPLLTIKKSSSSGNLSLNCFACGETHSYLISSKSFFSGKATSFSCKVNDIDAFFTGSYDAVSFALSQLSDEIAQITYKYYENIEKTYGSWSAAAIRIIHEKSIEKRIICLCGGYEINLKLSDGGIYLICPKCGGSEFVPASTEEDINALMERRSILIK